MTRTSTCTPIAGAEPRELACSRNARPRRACIGSGSSFTWSRNSVPWLANSSRPGRCGPPPAIAPRSQPKSSVSSSSEAAAQLILTNGRARRGEAAWMARAASSLPVPRSPRSRTVTSVSATRPMTSSTAPKGAYWRGPARALTAKGVNVADVRSRFAVDVGHPVFPSRARTPRPRMSQHGTQAWCHGTGQARLMPDSLILLSSVL